KKTLYTTCVWNFPRVEVFLYAEEENCQYLEPTEQFEQAVEAALLLPTLHQQEMELKKVFNHYGQFYPKVVILGGQLFQTDTQTVDVTVNEQKHKNMVEAGFKAAIGLYSGGAGGGVSSNEQTSNQSTVQQSSTALETVGGDTLIGSNTSQWCVSVGDYTKWDVIEYGEFISTYELLRPTLRSRVKEVLKIQQGRRLRAEIKRRRFLKIFDLERIQSIICEIYRSMNLNDFLLSRTLKLYKGLSKHESNRNIHHISVFDVSATELSQYLVTIDNDDVQQQCSVAINNFIQRPLTDELLRHCYRLQVSEIGSESSIEVSFGEPFWDPTVLSEGVFGKLLCKRDVNGKYSINIVYIELTLEKKPAIFRSDVAVTYILEAHFKQASSFNKVQKALAFSWPVELRLAQCQSSVYDDINKNVGTSNIRSLYETLNRAALQM
ncbi:unnamed protein product, partial [Adineta ricciae]